MYVPLNIKTDNYLQSSMIKISDLVKFAKENNITSLTITDNNMYGVMDFYKMCINNNIKPIIGLEISISSLKVILYAKNYQGYQNLIKLTTLMSDKELEINILSKYCKHLIAILPYDSINLYDSLKDIYEDIFVAYKNEDEKEKIMVDKVYMNEILVLKKEECNYLKYLEAIRDGVTVNFIETDYSDNYLKLNIDDNNNKKINDMCNVEIPFHQDLMPKFVNELNMDSYSYLKKKCVEGLKNKFGNTISINYQKRLKYELEVINNMGFCDYFLIVADYVNYAKESDIIVGTGRGSAVGSLVSYCLNITDVDPLKYDLIFERFLNPERISMPDIDIDFEHTSRDKIINYCINKYGMKKVAPIIAFGTLAAKQAIRDVARVLNIDLKLVDNVAKLVDSTLSLNDNYNKYPKLREYLNRHQELLNMYNLAYHFEGLKRHTTIHAAGIIMSNIDLDSVIPLAKGQNDFYISGYDMTYLEDIGLLKMDFLAIKYLTTIHHIIDNINNHKKINITFDNIPLNDFKALDIFKRADTIGIFQFESSGMINFLKQLKPSTLEDIFAAIALFRPGPMKNIPTYIKRKYGKEKIDYYHPSLEAILKPTYGIIVYQEQIMQIANQLAGYSLAEADVLRKAMSKKKKDILINEREKFIKRSINKGYDEDLVVKIYDLMMRFAEYGFNKSHSVGYSIVAYKMAYLKAHYPEYFITELLSMEQGDTNKTKKYVYEAKKYGIDILCPDINKSSLNYTIEGSNIRFPLNHIKGINTITAQKIIDNKHGGYQDIYDFIKKSYGKNVNKKIIESLIYVGCFDSFGINRKTLIHNLDAIVNYGELIKDLDSEYVFKPELEYVNEYTKKELMMIEYEYLSIYITDNPVSNVRDKFDNIVLLENIGQYFNKQVRIVVLVERIKETKTKKDETMAFVTGSDEANKIDVVFFPKIYKEYNLVRNSIIVLEGKVEKRYDEYQIIATRVIDTILQGSN